MSRLSVHPSVRVCVRVCALFLVVFLGPLDPLGDNRVRAIFLSRSAY